MSDGIEESARKRVCDDRIVSEPSVQSIESTLKLPALETTSNLLPCSSINPGAGDVKKNKMGLEGETDSSTSIAPSKSATVLRRKKMPYPRRYTALLLLGDEDEYEDFVMGGEEDRRAISGFDFEELGAFECKECHKQFKSQTWLTRHLRSAHHHHTEKSVSAEPDYSLGDFFCQECPKRFKSQTWLTRHLRAEHEGRGVGSGSSSDSALASTNLNVEGEEEEEPLQRAVVAPSEISDVTSAVPLPAAALFECPECKRTFKTQKWLTVHLRRVHRPASVESQTVVVVEEEESEPSSQAESVTAVDDAQQQQQPQSTSAANTVECEICGMGFTTSSHLVLHRRVHSGDRPFECELCARTYKCLKSFNKHLKTEHLQEPVVTCTKCRAAFVTKELYELHWNTQRGKLCMRS